MLKRKLIPVLFFLLFLSGCLSGTVSGQDVYFTSHAESATHQVFFPSSPTTSTTDVYFTGRQTPGTINVYLHKGSMDKCDVTVKSESTPNSESIYASHGSASNTTDIFISGRSTFNAKHIHYSTLEHADFILCIPNDPFFISQKFSSQHIAAIVVLYYLKSGDQ